MKTFWLIRHAQSTSNAGEITRDRESVFLTDVGEQQAHWLNAHFPYHPNALYISTLPRTAQTAAPLARRFHMHPQILPCLTEFDPLGMSVLRGMKGEERSAAYENYWARATPETQIGEDGCAFTELKAQIDEFMQLLPHFANHSAFVGHSIWMKVLAWYLLGFAVNDNIDMRNLRQFQHAFPTPNACVFTLYYDTISKNAWLKALPQLTPPSARENIYDTQI